MEEKITTKKLEEYGFFKRFFLLRDLKKIDRHTLVCHLRAMYTKSTIQEIKDIQQQYDGYLAEQHDLIQKPQSAFLAKAYKGVIAGVIGVLLVDQFAGHAGLKKATIHMPLPELLATAIIVIAVVAIEFLIGKGIAYYAKKTGKALKLSEGTMSVGVLLPALITVMFSIAGVMVATGFPAISIAEYTDAIAGYELMLDRGRINQATFDSKVMALKFLYIPIAIFSAIGHLCIVFLHTVIIAAFSYFDVKTRYQNDLVKINSLMDKFRQQYTQTTNAFLARNLMIRRHISLYGVHEALPEKNPFPQEIEVFFKSIS